MTEGRGLRLASRPSAERELRLRRADAETLAREVVRRSERRPCALILLADGNRKIISADQPTLERWLQRAPGCLVGCYDVNAEASDVVDDIMVMGR